MAPIDVRELEDLRAAAENAQAHGARVTTEPALVLALIEERDHLRAAAVRHEYDAAEALAIAPDAP